MPETETTITISVVVVEVVPTDSSRLGDPTAEPSFERAVQRLQRSIESSGGTTVVSVGARVVATYPSLGGALDAVVGIQSRFGERRAASGERTLRIGVSSGDVSVVDGVPAGEPVDEAVVLCDHARPGTILTTDMVKWLARRGGHRFEPRESVVDPSTTAPLDVFELWWDATRDASAVPMPGRLALAPPTGVLGRSQETATLDAMLDSVTSGGGSRVALIEGEPGMGKTTLACALAQRAHADGVTVLYGRCDDDLGIPYQPFVEAIGGFVRNSPEERLRLLGPRHLSALSLLVPEVRRRCPDLPELPTTDPDAERYRLFGAVSAVLSAMAWSAPVVLVVEDLHWADKPTALLFSHVVTTVDDSDVFVIATLRPGDLGAEHPLVPVLESLSIRPNVAGLFLAGLAVDAVQALVEGMAGHELDGDGIALVHAVQRETGGNPFFCSEILRHLAASDAIRQVDGRWIAVGGLASIGLPDSVREVIGQRVRGLGDDLGHILSLASVVGRDFDLSLVARLADHDEAHLRRHLATAVDAMVLEQVSETRYSFAHALIQHTLYDSLSASRRARTHRRVAVLLEADIGDELGDRTLELARHWVAAPRSEGGRAAVYAYRAGLWALRSLAPDEAIRWLERALRLIDDAVAPSEEMRLDVLIALGDAQRQAGDPGFRDVLLDVCAAAEQSGDTARMVRATLANQRGMVSNIGVVDPERVEALERALVAIGESDSADRATLLAVLAAELTFSRDVTRIRSLAAEAESTARRVGDEATLLRVLNLVFLPLWVPDMLHRNLERCREASELAARVGDPVARLNAAINWAQLMISNVDRREIEMALAMAQELAVDIGQSYMRWQVSYLRCVFALTLGDADAAETIAEEALVVGTESGQPDVLVVYGANLLNIRFHQDRLEEVIPLAELSATENPGLPTFRAALAMALCECGRLDEARALIEAAREEDFHPDAYDYVWLTTMTLWSDAAATLDDAASATMLYERIAPFETHGVSSGASFNGTVGMFLARLADTMGHRDEAIDLFARADRRLEQIGAPFWRGRNRMEWARSLVARGSSDDLDTARDLLGSAVTLAREHQCPGLLRHAQALRAQLSESAPQSVRAERQDS